MLFHHCNVTKRTVYQINAMPHKVSGDRRHREWHRNDRSKENKYSSDPTSYLHTV